MILRGTREDYHIPRPLLCTQYRTSNDGWILVFGEVLSGISDFEAVSYCRILISNGAGWSSSGGEESGAIQTGSSVQNWQMKAVSRNWKLSECTGDGNL